MDMAKPKIRFKGYTDDWEQRKLLDCIQKITDFRGRTPKKLGMDWSEEGYLALSALNVKDGYIDFNQDVHYGNQELYDKWMTGNELHKGQVLFTTEAPMGNVAQVPDNRRYILSQRTIAFEVKNKLITENFLATVLRTPTVFADLTALSSGGTAKGVSQKSLASVEIRLPKDLNEQEKIANTFYNLDHLITLHQRKCEETKKLKKYMLQKMFPQNGQTVPEIRFVVFTDAWEQRKLGDLVDRVTRKNQDLVSELPLTISAQYGLIDQNEFFDKRVASKDVSGYYLIENGEFAYNKSTSTDAPWGAVKRLDRYENGVLSTLYIVFGIKENNPVDSDFLVSYYSTNLWHKGIHEIAAEGARNHGLLNIAPADFFETELTIPQDIEEQKKIGKYFEELERLITLHQCKCHLLLKLLHNDWEQRKLGDILISLQNNTLSRADLSNEAGVAKNVHYGDVLIKFGEVLDVSKEKLPMISDESVLSKYKSSFLQNGDAIVADTAEDFTVGKCSEIAGLNDVVVLSGLHTIPYRPIEKFASGYLGYYLNSSAYHNQLIPLMQGIKVTSISKSAMQDTDIVYPKSVEEQGKIGNYFQSLDHLITLRQRKNIYF